MSQEDCEVQELRVSCPCRLLLQWLRRQGLPQRLVWLCQKMQLGDVGSIGTLSANRRQQLIAARSRPNRTLALIAIRKKTSLPGPRGQSPSPASAQRTDSR